MLALALTRPEAVVLGFLLAVAVLALALALRPRRDAVPAVSPRQRCRKARMAARRAVRAAGRRC